MAGTAPCRSSILRGHDVPRRLSDPPDGRSGKGGGVYVEWLGFEERYRFGNFAVVGLETFDLGLTEVEEVEPAGRAALWLYTDDADAEIDRLRAAGLK